MVPDYSKNTQVLLLRHLITDHTLYTQCQDILKHEYFDKSLQFPVEFIKEFANEYNSLPSPEIVYSTTGLELEKLPIEDIKTKWFLDTFEKFCRHKAMELLILEGPNLLEKGDYAKIEQKSKENGLISLQRDIGTSYFENPEARLERTFERSNMTSTGWKDIDHALFGGMNRGEITVWLGLPSAGKSLFLQNIALNWVESGKNVVYISLELSEELVSLRFDAMLTGMGTRTIFSNRDTAVEKLSILKKFGHRGKKFGDLNIKKMPEAGTCVNNIRAYLKEYELQTGNKVDALCVDYLDLLYPNSAKVDINSSFTKDKFVSEELRALAAEYNILCNTASQINRSGVQEQDFDYSHVAGGISKVNTADNVLGIFTSPVFKEQGKYEIQFLKTRSSSGVGSKVPLTIYKESLRIVDYEGEDDDGKPNLEKLIKSKPKEKDIGDSISKMRSLGAKRDI